MRILRDWVLVWGKMAPEGEQFMEIRCKKENGSRKCEFRDECCNMVDQLRPLKKTIATKVLKKMIQPLSLQRK